MSQHTPGPWEVETVGRDGSDREPKHCEIIGPIPTRAGRTGVIADTLNCDFILSPDDQYANARLIAAAPDLLAALKEVVRISDRKHDAWEAARAIIAKAEGR